MNGSNGNILGDGSGHLLDIHSILDTTLADNGGPTLTQKLVDSSPAINAGDPLFDPNAFDPPLVYDQRGPGFDRVKNGRLDIGAYEGIANPVLPGGILQVGTFDDTLADDGVWSLREAVMYANSHPGDFTIQLSAGTYTLTRQGAAEDAAFTGDLDVLDNGRLTILGAGAAATTIDAFGLVDPAIGYGDRIFDVHPGAPLDLEGITLSGGAAPNTGSTSERNGGAIRNSGGLLSIADSDLTANSAHYGGGIYNVDGRLIISGTSVSKNTASDSGGAIAVNNSLSAEAISISDSELSDNSASISAAALTLAQGK